MYNLYSEVVSHDLKEAEGVKDYLEKTSFAAKDVARLSGGYGNYTYRVQLLDAISTGHSSVVLKHAEGLVPGTNILLSVERTDVEVAALEKVSSASFMTNSQYTKLRLPELLAYDQINRVQVFVDYGNIPSLKKFCISNERSQTIDDMVEEIGNTLGNFLADLHIWGYKALQDGLQPISGDMTRFRDNNDGKRICAWRTGGRLSETATKFNVDGNWDIISGDLQKSIMENNETFNMGDFWTGNVLVDADVENKRINQLIILDWELAKTGPAATDVGQFAAESYMLQKLTPRSAGGALLRSFLTKYKSVISASIKGQKISATLFDPQGIVACIAAHAAVWGSLVSWADAETTRATVETALGLCKHAMTGDLQDIKDTELSVLMD